VNSSHERSSAREQVVQAVYTQAPVRLADLAPLVTAAHDAGDPVAVDIVEGAARRLADTLARLPEAEPSGPIVLAGSLTRPESPIGARLRVLLAEQSSAPFSGDPVTARDEVVGAAWLALLSAGAGLATAPVRAQLAGRGDVIRP
jgi:glucosamine kinase